MKLSANINLHNISDLLISKTGLSDSDAALFLKELFSVILDRLLLEDSVEIDSLGTFSINHVRNEYEYYYIDFVPSSILNDSINKPFVNFEITKVNDGVDFGDIRVVDKDDDIVKIDASHDSVLYIVEDEILEDKDDEGGIENDSLVIDQQQDIHNDYDSKVELIEPKIETPIIPIIDAESSIEDEAQDILEDDKDSISNNIDTHLVDDTPNIERKKGKRKNILMFAAASVVVLLALSAFFLKKKLNSESLKTVVIGGVDNDATDIYMSEVLDSLENVKVTSIDSMDIVVDTIQEILKPKVETIIKPEVVTLTMGKTLRLIALEKYGHREFWVYIYLENKNKIANPNNVPVGVKLTIAPKEKYGINANNSSSISKAIARGNEELNKFR